MKINTVARTKLGVYNTLLWSDDKEFQQGFLDVVSVGEMIEAGVKQGKIEALETKKQIFKRKKREKPTW